MEIRRRRPDSSRCFTTWRWTSFYLVEEARERMGEEHCSRPTARLERQVADLGIHVDHEQDTHCVHE